ncbi:MAG TPA: hypothetical protein VE127_17120 [Solirubrobacteraceae bacterium]|jgi:hypothetical protein|nr:hypothetical protein [Solirubrobacteraceae bacterium]
MLTSQSPIARLLAPLAALGLGVACVVHLIDGPGSLTDQFYAGALELALAAACLPLAILLLVRPLPILWSTALALNLAGLLVFVASRTVGLPGSTDDIGNWGQTLGVVNVVAELGVIAAAAAALGRRVAFPLNDNQQRVNHALTVH